LAYLKKTTVQPVISHCDCSKVLWEIPTGIFPMEKNIYNTDSRKKIRKVEMKKVWKASVVVHRFKWFPISESKGELRATRKSQISPLMKKNRFLDAGTFSEKDSITCCMTLSHQGQGW